MFVPKSDLYFIYILTACHGASVKNITLQVLQKNIFENRNKPFCVMYKSECELSKL